MKKIHLTIIVLMGLSQTLHAADWESMQAELALLKQLNGQRTDKRFSRHAVLPPITQRKHHPKPPAKPKEGARAKNWGRTYIVLPQQTHASDNTQKQKHRKKWNKDKKQKTELVEALRKLQCPECDETES